MNVQILDKTNFRHVTRKSAPGASRGVENLHQSVTPGKNFPRALRAHHSFFGGRFAKSRASRGAKICTGASRTEKYFLPLRKTRKKPSFSEKFKIRHACTVLSRVCVVARSHKRKFVPQPEDPDVITPKKKKERDGTVTRPYKCGFTPEERVD